MRITSFLTLLLLAPLTMGADIVWCNAKGECITQLDRYKLVNVPFYWKTPNIVEIRDGAKNVQKEPKECDDELVVSPAVCEK